MSSATPTSPRTLPRPKPPLWALGLAILLGALGALLSPFGHVHDDGGGAYAHQHAFAGPHSHGPDSGGAPRPAEDAERSSVVLALASAISLGASAPALGPAPEAPLRLAALPPPTLPPAAGHAAPWSPRGPPAFLR